MKLRIDGNRKEENGQERPVPDKKKGGSEIEASNGKGCG